MSISASHKKIYEVLSPRHYEFIIPAYQRPYAWDKDLARALVQDLVDAYREYSAQEYFLGSIVVVRRYTSSADAEVVDGQQRLTSLSILMAVIRSLLPISEGVDITGLLVSEFLGKRKVGLRLRTSGLDSDDNFFDDHIRNDGGIAKLERMKAVLSSSQQCIASNALEMKKEIIKNFSSSMNSQSHDIKDFLNFVLEKSCLVVVESTDFDSAYRIFSTMNNRGLRLGVSDLIKAVILEQLPNEKERDEVNQIWEQEEADLTRLASSTIEDDTESRRYFELLFTHIHRIASKRRSSKNLFDDFKKDVLNVTPQSPLIGQDRAKEFVTQILVRSSNAYESILKKAIPIPDLKTANLVNKLYLPLLENIPNSDWQSVAISFIISYHHQMGSAQDFFGLLERVAAISLILGENVNGRVKRYSPVLQALESSQEAAMAELQASIKDEEKHAVMKAINEKVYGQTFAFYVMLRLDSALAEGGISPSLSAPRASIEHVAPQTLREEWRKDWTDEAHNTWVNKIGNLVLLSKRKNSRAQNFDFITKKETYFAGKFGQAGDIATFPSVTKVLNAGERWSPDAVAKNQVEYVSLLSQAWALED